MDLRQLLTLLFYLRELLLPDLPVFDLMTVIKARSRTTKEQEHVNLSKRCTFSHGELV